MKKIILSTVTAVLMASTAQAADTISDSLKNGKLTVNARLLYFDRTFDKANATDATSFTLGGFMKYLSDDYKGLKMGLAYYGSNRVSGILSKEDGRATSNLTSTGENINMLGEAYLQYDKDKTMVKVGRQGLKTPLMQNHDLRLLPSLYEGAIVKNNSFEDTKIELGYIWAYTGFGSRYNDFSHEETKWGKSGLGYIYLINNSIKKLKVSAQYVKQVSDKDSSGNQVVVADYRYADAVYALPFGKNSYIKAQYGGNSYNRAKNPNFPSSDSVMLGAKAGTTLGMVNLAILTNSISGNAFKAVESGPMYSDWQQGYGPYEPSTAFGGQMIVKPKKGFSLKAAYVKISADRNFRKDGTFTDDYSEINLDVQYALDDMSKLRARYSIKDQSKASDREDRNDLRLFYYLNF